MRRGLFLSFVLHAFLLALLVFKVPNPFPEPDVRVMRVTLVASPDVKKVKEPKKIKKVRTQQSAAPKKASKPKKPKPKAKTPKHDTKVVQADALKKKKIQQAKKKERPKPAKEEKAEPKQSRPEKLDKTPEKKNLIKETNEDVPRREVKEDDFLAALSFVKKLENRQSALSESKKETEKTTITAEMQAEIAVIRQHIERNWYRPPGLKNAGQLSARVEVEIRRDGSIADVKLLRSSGEQFYDNSLLRAVRKSVPLPIPGDKYETFKILDLHFRG